MHIPEKQQYFTASWDRTIRVWRAYQQGGRHGKDEKGKSSTNAADEADQSPDEGTSIEEHQPTYAELHPLIEPRCLQNHAARGYDYFAKKVAAEDSKDKRKKKQNEDELASKHMTGLALKLNELESELRNSLTRTQEKPPSKEDKTRSRQNTRVSRATVKGKSADSPKRL